ncbi:MAG: zinc-binding dehydrogenase [Candidatus Gastranaerophilales bacterium]|nr:zinc-binding dehydrogenase [Candidatus Gastranaerophilales bacterium]
MKAAVYSKIEKVELREIENIFLKNKKGAIVKTYGCGLCGSDMVKISQNLVKEGTVLGHEAVGEIVEINSDNKTFKLGDKVAFSHHVPCFECIYCKNENFSMCKHFKETNLIPGGFSEYIYLSEDHLNNVVFKISENITEIQASLMEPSACCLRAIKRANVKQNDNVLIIGLGFIGLLMGQIAKSLGAKVFGTDILEERIDIAKQIGFDNAINSINSEKIKDFLFNATSDIGFDKVFLCAGNASTVDFSVLAVRDGGTILVFSSVSDNKTAFANNDIYYRELTILGSYSPSCEDLKESIELIEKGIIKVDKYVKIYPLTEIKQAIADTEKNRTIKAFIKI